MWWAALAGTVVYLDTSVIGQTLIGQPIVACVAYGFWVDRPELGLFFGVLFELLWLANLQIGAAKFSEGSLGAIIATATAARVAPSAATGDPSWMVMLLCVGLGLVFAHLGRELAPLVRRMMNRVAASYVDACVRHDQSAARGWTLTALGVHVAAGALFTLAGVVAGHFMLRLYFGEFYAAGPGESVVGSTDALCSGVWPGLLGAGAAAAMLQLTARRDWIWVMLVGAAGAWLLI
ncbi:MAG: PTS sugar transporter subunit IIC [Calditrichaeota bacterium]|nr:PTS sugar transporter subunit IIC [Calditrichota bacterium]MCB9391826.1 PTS sugar transporter subunit IIC [Calditrichota bacterium]